MLSSLAANLDPYFRELAEQARFSGVVRITQGEQELFADAYGYASRAWKVPNTLEMRFDTASITKVFTAVATLQLIERGLLSFDTSVIDLLQLRGTQISPDVTLYHLLTHSSGIADDAEEEAGESYEAIWQNQPNYRVTQTADFLPNFVYKPANFAPGAGCRYCNCGYVLLGLALERVTGMSYRDYVMQQLFAPAGISDSGFFHKAEVHERLAEGCDPIQDDTGQVLGWKRNIYSFPPIGSPDGGAYVTAADLDRFMRAVQQGKLLSPSMTKIFFTPQVLYRDHGDWQIVYGHGIWFRIDKMNGKIVCYQKEGFNPGVSGMIRCFPEQEIHVVILSNMQEGAWEPIRKIHDLITEQK